MILILNVQNPVSETQVKGVLSLRAKSWLCAVFNVQNSHSISAFYFIYLVVMTVSLIN